MQMQPQKFSDTALRKQQNTQQNNLRFLHGTATYAFRTWGIRILGSRGNV